MNKKSTYTLETYVSLVRHYLQTGQTVPPDPADPLHRYLSTLMADPLLTAQVLTDDISARIFYDNIMQFIQYYLDRDRYNLQKLQAETDGMQQASEWSDHRRRNGWQALVKEVGEKYIEYGFDAPFYLKTFTVHDGYTDDRLWQQMLDDWKKALQLKQHRQRQQAIDDRGSSLERRLHANLQQIPEYLRQHSVEKEEFFQAWGMMEGMWNVREFERFRQIVRLQREYPVLLEIARCMGRTADTESKQRMFVSAGHSLPLEHASHSDIEGITLGNDLGSLLPGELAQYLDNGLEDLFLYKYLGGKLQMFRHKSQSLNPARTLESRPARLKGPMIVCLDTSGSMAGFPEKIASSLLIKLVETADRQHRDCYLIAFSVSTRPIDVRRERARLLDFFSRTATGDTDATRMLEATFSLLGKRPEYMNADVLWISDFKIPLSRPQLLEEMLQWRKKRGTRFYGLQIGIAENRWLPFFDKIYREEYWPGRKY